MTDYEEIKVIKDHMIDTWPLMSSPGPVLLIVSTYLLFVIKIGPKIMKNRPPFELKYYLIAYNAFLVIFNLWLSLLIANVDKLVLIPTNDCNSRTKLFKQELGGARLSNASWWYFFSKIIELIDTVFFVLRKKQNQVTFLHIYHHSMTTLVSWYYLKIIPSEQGIIIGLINSMVHVVMYTYYLITALGPNYKRYLWWKKYITIIQLIQFFLIMAYLLLVLIMDCEGSKSLTYFFMANLVMFIYLFSNFYKKAYTKAKKV